MARNDELCAQNFQARAQYEKAFAVQPMLAREATKQTNKQNKFSREAQETQNLINRMNQEVLRKTLMDLQRQKLFKTNMGYN